MSENLNSGIRQSRRWVAMFVGLPAPLACQCETLVAPLAVVRMSDALEATDRMLQVRPLLVVAWGDKDSEPFRPLRERCVDAGAVLIALPLGSTLAYSEVMVRGGLRVVTP